MRRRNRRLQPRTCLTEDSSTTLMMTLLRRCSHRDRKRKDQENGNDQTKLNYVPTHCVYNYKHEVPVLADYVTRNCARFARTEGGRVNTACCVVSSLKQLLNQNLQNWRWTRMTRSTSSQENRWKSPNDVTFVYKQTNCTMEEKYQNILWTDWLKLTVISCNIRESKRVP